MHKKVLAVLALLLCCVACTSDQIVEKTISYNTVILRNFSIEEADFRGQGDIVGFSKSLPSRLSQVVKDYLTTKTTSVNVLIEDKWEEKASNENTIIVEGKFTQVAASWRGAKIGAVWSIIDGKTENIIATHNTTGRISGGRPGLGELSSHLRRVAEKVAETVIKCLK